MRKLATIQRIEEIKSIENSDNLEVARVLGWWVVVKKNEFVPGDFCLYVEIDSILPDHEIFEIRGQRSLRIKTAKLRGQISQGICFNLGQLRDFINDKNGDDHCKRFDVKVNQEDIDAPQECNHLHQADDRFTYPWVVLEGSPYVPAGTCCLSLGEDLTDYLGVVKYDPEAGKPLPTQAKGSFPGFLKKTDETRIQSIPWLLDEVNVSEENPWVGLEKLDGQSVTLYHRNGAIGVCSRNLELKLDQGGSMVDWVNSNGLLERLKETGRNLALQGEFLGPGVQGNKYKLSNYDVYFFSLFDIDTFSYLGFNEMKKLVEELGEKICPIRFVRENPFEGVDKLLEMSILKSDLRPDVWAEGVVWRPIQEDKREFKGLNRVSFKAINNNWLLKYNE